MTTSKTELMMKRKRKESIMPCGFPKDPSAALIIPALIYLLTPDYNPAPQQKEGYRNVQVFAGSPVVSPLVSPLRVFRGARTEAVRTDSAMKGPSTEAEVIEEGTPAPADPSSEELPPYLREEPPEGA
ncbi:hypothetical protein MHYP_G00118490 [Metynnis hypsauchen]